MVGDPPWRFDPSNLDRRDITLHGLRVLVVAESHYRERRPDSDFKRSETQEIVNLHGIGVTSSSARSSLFRKIAETLADDEAQGAGVWQRIHFYNYFQRVMDDPSEDPTPEDFRDAVVPFDAVLAALRPDAILVMSARVWKKMKNECIESGDCALGTIFDFNAGGSLKIPGAHTHHPSARPPHRFEPEHWRPRVLDFLRVVRERRTAAN
jgi:hypothetical protein